MRPNSVFQVLQLLFLFMQLLVPLRWLLLLLLLPNIMFRELQTPLRIRSSRLKFARNTHARRQIGLLVMRAAIWLMPGGGFTKLKQSFEQRFETCVKKLRMK
jgi:hypothetical protein